MGKLTCKGKHTVKVGNYPRRNIMSKSAIIKRGGEEEKEETLETCESVIS